MNNCSAISLYTGFSNINLKHETLDDDFGMNKNNLSSSKGYLQDFQDLEQFPMASAFCNWGTGIQGNGFDPFPSFPHSSSTDFGLYRCKPYEDNGMLSAIQDFQGGGFLSFPERKDSSLVTKIVSEYNPKALCFVVPDESSCVTGDNFGYRNKDGSKRNKNLFHGNNRDASEFASTKKGARAPKKSKSAKGQWTAEEDR